MDKKNRIILLIDFSEYSINLIDFAFLMAEIIKAKVIFVHQVAGISPALAAQETKDEIAQIEINEAYAKLRKLAQGRVHDQYEFLVSPKPMLSLLREVASDEYFDWVFAGQKGTGALKRLFIGSTTLSIVNDSELLTVAVPVREPLDLPQKLMVGVNPKYALNDAQLTRVLSTLNTQIIDLEFFSIVKEEEDPTLVETYLKELQKKYESYNPVIRLYKGANAFNTLKERIELTKNSFLILQQGSRSLTEQLFRKFMINELAYSAKIPLIVLSK